MIKKIIYLLLPVVGTLQAQPLTFHEAERLYEADEFEAAEQAYKQIEDSADSRMIKQAAMYNRGLVLAADGRWAGASSIFRQLLLSSEKMPRRLRKDVQEALVLALTEQAKEALEDPMKINIASDWIREARGLLKEVMLTQRGAEVEALYARLNAVESQVVDKQYYMFSIPKDSLTAFWRVQLTLISLNSHIQNLIALQDDPRLQGQYLQAYLSQDSRLLELFDNLAKILPGEQNAPLETMRKKFNAYLRALGEGSLKNASSSLEALDTAFAEWSDTLFTEEKDAGRLMKLFALYTLALRGDYITSATVQVLLKNFEAVKTDDGTLPQEFVLSRRYAEEAAEALGRGRQVLARIYLEMGQNVLAQKIYKSDKEQFTAEDYLTLILYAQGHAARLTRLAAMNPAENDKVVQDILSRSQKDVLRSLEGFPAAAYQEQQKGFAFSDKRPGRCQHHPWNEVMTLFYKGWAAAEKGTGSVVSQVLQSQEEAMRYIGDALKALKAPIPKGQDSCYKAQPPPPPKPSEEDKGEKKPQPRIDEVLRQIQQMEQDDKVEKSQNVIRRGSKPW